KQAMDEHAKNLDAVRQQSTAGLQEIRQEATSKVAEVGTPVAGVKTDIDETKSALANSKSARSKEIGDVRDSLGRQIAHNSDELAVLKRRGERDFFEFDLRKTKDMARVAGIRP